MRYTSNYVTSFWTFLSQLSVLKHEKEVLSNAEKRASDEVRSLSERVQRLQVQIVLDCDYYGIFFPLLSIFLH